MAKRCCWVKLRVAAPGEVVLSSTETVSSCGFATIRSGLPSALTSAAVTEADCNHASKTCAEAKLAVVAPGTVLLSNVETVPVQPFATITSGLPSPLRSAAVTEPGAQSGDDIGDVLKMAAGSKLNVVAPGAVLFRNTEIVPCWSVAETIRLAVTRSGRPSPLKSAVVTDVGDHAPVGNSCCAPKLGVEPGAVVLSDTET